MTALKILLGVLLCVGSLVAVSPPGPDGAFHHTTADEDGVRLGCYGHYVDGKLYSTEYVNDTKGYRLVSNEGLIPVYPKSGGERKASMIRGLSEEKIKTQNIGFFFPDGCPAK